MSSALHDDETRVSPTTSQLDTSVIAGVEWLPSAHGYAAIRYVRAPLTGGPHTLKFRTSGKWGSVAVPGGHDATDAYVHTATLQNGEPLGPLQIIAIVKSDTTAGSWTVTP